MPRVPPVTTATRAMPSSQWFPICLRRPAALPMPRQTASSALHAHRDAHAAADAQGRQALLGVALGHLVQQRDQDARSRRADGMTQRDRTAVHVDLVRIEAEILVDGASLCGESLVGFDEIEVVGL